MPLLMLTIARPCKSQEPFKLGSKRAVKQPREKLKLQDVFRAKQKKNQKGKEKPLGGGPEGTPRARLVEVAITEGVLQERA